MQNAPTKMSPFHNICHLYMHGIFTCLWLVFGKLVKKLVVDFKFWRSPTEMEETLGGLLGMTERGNDTKVGRLDLKEICSCLCRDQRNRLLVSIQKSDIGGSKAISFR